MQRRLRALRAVDPLNHPNIRPVWYIWEEDGCLYLTLPYLDGQTLAEVLRAGQRLPPRRAVAIVHTLARAVQEAHRHGLMHHDLKPAKVMIKRGGEPVIMDFGLARRIELDTYSIQQLENTPAYLSPEQVQGGLDAIG